MLFVVLGLPSTGSWQDVKDHMREAGDVCYADVFKDGTGVVEFLRYEDMKYAVRKLDDSKFRSHEVGCPMFLLFQMLRIAQNRRIVIYTAIDGVRERESGTLHNLLTLLVLCCSLI